ncbi:MAG: MBL fold metallo-hydrolase [Acidimicrobiales bacterium]
MTDDRADPAAPAPLVLTVLGCDGSWTGPGGAGSGYLVESARTRLVIDTGPGTFAVLQQHMDPAAIDAVIISHHHPDHWSDLYMMGSHARFALQRTGLPVYAPAGLARRAHLEDSRTFEWHRVTHGDSIGIGDLGITFRRTEHSFETLAVRIDGSVCALGYSADTGPGWRLVDLGSGLDLVLCEATYTIEHEGTADHMSGRQAGEQAREAQARRLVITHRWPSIEASDVATEARGAFGGPVEQAEPGKGFVL